MVQDDSLGEVSMVTNARPQAAAFRWAPDFWMKFSSLHVRPDSQYKTCHTGAMNHMLAFILTICSVTIIDTQTIINKPTNLSIQVLTN